MAKKCEICGKAPIFGKNRSKSDRRTPRRWNPNLQHIRVKQDEVVKKIWVCTQCIKSGKIKKA
ncbi:MAG: 50S ribosomal protein L28 [Candidatus Cloacimonetes bacterium]|nr:50S ribosomal protein L28 [Candidatus Cloacimonadota bacterium]MBL7108162.1 50S ribosomal protein L28 [Candidatus Cloacimonadota bacterium]